MFDGHDEVEQDPDSNPRHNRREDPKLQEMPHEANDRSDAGKTIPTQRQGVNPDSNKSLNSGHAIRTERNRNVRNVALPGRDGSETMIYHNAITCVSVENDNLIDMNESKLRQNKRFSSSDEDVVDTSDELINELSIAGCENSQELEPSTLRGVSHEKDHSYWVSNN